MDSVNSTLESLTTLVGDSEISSDDITRLREIGRGNFGVVYEGLCQRKQVAVKDIPCSLSSGVLEDVRQEVKINLALRHPNVVLTIGACTTVPGKVTIVSEFMKTDLKKLILEGKEIVPFLKRMRMCRDAAAGILWLHTRNPPIVHRDIKLDNFLVGDNDVVKVCDFGLSQVKVAPTLVDKKGRGRGTPIWMAPEVLSGKPLTEKADVYSFGLLIWSMVTCREYFTSIRTYEGNIKILFIIYFIYFILLLLFIYLYIRVIFFYLKFLFLTQNLLFCLKLFFCLKFIIFIYFFAYRALRQSSC